VRREEWAATGAIGASLLLASCCLAPTLFLLFGVSLATLSQLAYLEPYRPLFLALGGGALLYAAWRAWRPAAGSVCATQACTTDLPSRQRTRLLVLVAVLCYVLAIAYPYVLAALL
jgi:mercuric ion transport protein